MSGPLAGLKVLDFSRVLAGPFAGRMLSDLGADVVKVEPPEGDVTRLWGRKVAGLAGYYFQQNAGKRGMCLDLKAPAGRELARRLAARADILIENFRPGVMSRLGLDYATLEGENPGLIMLSISGFGADSPEAGRAAYAPIIHAETGLIAGQQRRAELGGGDQVPPVDLVTSFADTAAGLHGLVATLAALHMRHGSGRGQHVDLAMVDAAMVTDDRIHYALDGLADAEPRNAEVWETAGGPLMIASDFRHVWRQLVSRCGLTDPTPTGASLEEKIACRRDAVRRFFGETLKSRAEVIEALDKANLAWGDVRTRTTSADLPTVRHRRSIEQVDDRAGGTRPVPATPYRMSAAVTGIRGGAPHLGEHNAAVLSDWLGLTQEALAPYASVLIAPETS
jgi:crotonobetainyl-CoA:carnitine CoA-transferase CaiB-like acyl-CoA transferase